MLGLGPLGIPPRMAPLMMAPSPMLLDLACARWPSMPRGDKCSTSSWLKATDLPFLRKRRMGLLGKAVGDPGVLAPIPPAVGLRTTPLPPSDTVPLVKRSVWKVSSSLLRGEEYG